MVLVPIFTGRVSDDGGTLMLTPNERALRERHRRSLAGKEIELIIRKKRKKRSLNLNAYWHAVPFPMIAEYIGETVEVAKLLILGECFGWTEVRGYRFPVKPSTAELTDEEGSFLTEWMPPWGFHLSNGTMQIPLPEKAAA